jgi:hypothetical protein
MPYSRAKAVETIQGWLVRSSLPRLQMFIMVLLTGLAGFGVSFGLLHAGIGHMWVRYPASIIVAYALFLGMLRIWLWLANPDRSYPRIDARLDGVDASGLGDVRPPRLGSGFTFGGKGDYGGGGASDSWDASSPRDVQMQGVFAGVSAGRGGQTGGGGGGSSLGGIDLGDDGVWIVVAIAAVLAVVVACGYVIWVAPALFAEVLLDGLLASRLYRHMRSVETGYWLWTAVRKTAVAVVVIVLFAGLAGFALEMITPGARSIGDVWRGVPPPRSEPWPGSE